MNTKPTFSTSTTATRKNLKPVALQGISDLDRQARADTYRLMAGWVKAMPNTKSAREKRHRELLLSCIEADLWDLGYSLEEVSK
jgi:hypothetical protein